MHVTIIPGTDHPLATDSATLPLSHFDSLLLCLGVIIVMIPSLMIICLAVHHILFVVMTKHILIIVILVQWRMSESWNIILLRR